MDNKAKIMAMVQEIKSEAILKKLYRIVRVFWKAENGSKE